MIPLGDPKNNDAPEINHQLSTRDRILEGAVFTLSALHGTEVQLVF